MVLRARGTRWAIATPHALASQAGAAAFERGGNAIDAALAAATALAVVYPHMCGVGGDLFALVQHPDGDVVGVNSSGAAPAGIDPDEARSVHDTMPGRGPLTVTVPGAVAGWSALHRLGAALPWKDAFRASIGHAREGVPVAGSLAGAIARGAAPLSDPGLAATFFRKGRPLALGEELHQPALASTLAELAGGGPDALYRGEIGERYAAGLREVGVPIRPADLASHEAEIVTPLIGRFRDLDVRVAPPTSQGFVLLEALAAIDRLEIDPDPLGADAGALALVFAAVARDRDRHLADPRHMRIHPLTLLDDGHIAALCDEVRAGATAVPQPASRDTAGLVAIDAGGTAVSLIQSLSWGFGAGLLEPSTGIVAQNRGSGFTLDPSHPNALAPGKRPAHTLMPVMAHRDGRLAAVSGTMGGPAHPQINAWSLIRTLVLGQAPHDVVEAPRWLAGGMDAIDGIATTESSVPGVVRDRIERAGFVIEELPDLDESTGHAHLICVGTEGEFDVATDPRADGSALAS